jgi:glucose-specific phosphotransferase system IIA component
MVGDGYAIVPNSGTNKMSVSSPVNGTVIGITEGAHAYSIQADSGDEILVHIGIDTVELKGEGLEPKVVKGARVRVNDLLALVDAKMIRERGFDLTVPVVISNLPEGVSVTVFEGMTEAGSLAAEY